MDQYFLDVFLISGRISREFIIKSIKSSNCEQTSLPLKKEKYCFYDKVDLYSDDSCFDSFNLHFSLLVSTINRGVKLVQLQPYDRNYFSVKTANTCIFSTVKKIISVVSPTPELDAAVNCKPYT